MAKNQAVEACDWVVDQAVQLHGGAGYLHGVEVERHYRDARILPIYEGTTAIQANDLVGRKTGRDGGQSARAIAAPWPAQVCMAPASDARSASARTPAIKARCTG